MIQDGTRNTFSYDCRWR